MSDLDLNSYFTNIALKRNALICMCVPLIFSKGFLSSNEEGTKFCCNRAKAPILLHQRIKNRNWFKSNKCIWCQISWLTAHSIPHHMGNPQNLVRGGNTGEQRMEEIAHGNQNGFKRRKGKSLRHTESHKGNFSPQRFLSVIVIIGQQQWPP